MSRHLLGRAAVSKSSASLRVAPTSSVREPLTHQGWARSPLGAGSGNSATGTPFALVDTTSGARRVQSRRWLLTAAAIVAVVGAVASVRLLISPASPGLSARAMAHPLAALDVRAQQWQERVGEFQASRAALEGDDSLSPQQRLEAIETLLHRSFGTYERLRVLALDRMHP